GIMGRLSAGTWSGRVAACLLPFLLLWRGFLPPIGSVGYLDSQVEKPTILFRSLGRFRLHRRQHDRPRHAVSRQMLPRGNDRDIRRAEAAATPERGRGRTAGGGSELGSFGRSHGG